MSLQICSAAILGLSAFVVRAEADVASGLARFNVVGLPDTAVREARERIRAALTRSGFRFPRTRVTVNLAPADLKKEGPGYDFPIAVSVLLIKGYITAKNPKIFDESILIGELALDGTLRPVRGIIPIALAARGWSRRRLFFPEENAKEAAIVPGIQAYPIKNLAEFAEHMNMGTLPDPLPHQKLKLCADRAEYNFSEIRGQEQAKRALLIAAAGAHNILLSGSPGAGKTMLARAMPGILPPLSRDEAFELTRIWSAAGKLDNERPVVNQRPFRSPHHSSSAISLVGGGASPRPGEISLAHRGVLFLDEFPEFERHALEHLRQPLEDGFITIARAEGTVRFPARFLLMAAKNPCPCGYLNDPKRECICAPHQILKYHKKISGPLLDRIDMHVELQPVAAKDLKARGNGGETSAELRTRVIAARERQTIRLKKYGISTNSEMTNRMLEDSVNLEKEARKLLEAAINKYDLSARAYFRIIKLAQTIADLDAAPAVEQAHISEALLYRPRREY